MILKEFQKVFDIDNRIVQMHEQLSELYQTRASIVNPDQDGAPVARLAPPILSEINLEKVAPIKIWSIKKYEELQRKWRHYNIKFPEYKALETKLFDAYDILYTVSALLPELQGKLDIIAVPPKKDLKFPAQPKLRSLQNPTIGNDLLSSGLPKVKEVKDWRILIVYSATVGIYMDNPKKIYDQKLYLKANYDMSALGLLEYTALTLQNPELIDSASWTVLLKDHKGDKLVPYATFRDNRYRFDMDKIDSLQGNLRFRPAIEVKL